MQNGSKYHQLEHIFDVQGTCRWGRNLKPGVNECWDVQHSFATGPGPLHDHTVPRSTKMKKNCFNSGSYLDSILRQDPATNDSSSVDPLFEDVFVDTDALSLSHTLKPGGK